MLSRLLAAAACVSLGACSLFSGDSEPEQSVHSRLRGVQFGQDAEPAESPDNVDAWRVARATVLRTFAFRALEKGLIEEARNYLQEACETDPSDIASHAALARLFLAEGSRREALAYSMQAIQYAPNDPELNVVLAAALAETDQTEEATRALERAWQVSAGHPAFARAMLTHYAATGGDALARRFVEKILAESPGEAYAWALAGDVFLSEGDLDAATESYRKALERDPSTPVPGSINDRLGLGENNRDPVVASALEAESNGDLEGAERLFRFLARTKPDDKQVTSSLARILYKLDRMEEAEVALAVIPHETRSWREHLLQAKIDIRTGDFVSAKGSLLLTRALRPGIRAADLLMEYVAAQMNDEVSEPEEEVEEEFQAFDSIDIFEDSQPAPEAFEIESIEEASAENTEVDPEEVDSTESN